MSFHEFFPCGSAEILRQACRCHELQDADHGTERYGIGKPRKNVWGRHQAGHREGKQRDAEKADAVRAAAIDKCAAEERSQQLRERHDPEQPNGDEPFGSGCLQRVEMVEQECGLDRVDQKPDCAEVPNARVRTASRSVTPVTSLITPIAAPPRPKSGNTP